MAGPVITRMSVYVRLEEALAASSMSARSGGRPVERHNS